MVEISFLGKNIKKPEEFLVFSNNKGFFEFF